MPDPTLHGNGCACVKCSGTGSGYMGGLCTGCGGTGKVPIPPEDILAAQLAENNKGPR